VRFIGLRNQLAHGNLESVIEFNSGGPTDYIPEARQVALSHLKKAQAFVVEWFNAAPEIQGRLECSGPHFLDRKVALS
jgi:hypothetical protein